MRSRESFGTRRRDPFGKNYLQKRILNEFALAPHLRVKVDSADDDALMLRAPLAANSNDKGTAFGGSLFCLAVLTGWAWLTRYLAQHELDADAVIQESRIDYLLPVAGELHAALRAPPTAEVEKFRKALARAGRGRIHLYVEVRARGKLATRFEGIYVATARAATTARTMATIRAR
jgi:thioesterase domain-containing protein